MDISNLKFISNYNSCVTKKKKSNKLIFNKKMIIKNSRYLKKKKKINKFFKHKFDVYLSQTYTTNRQNQVLPEK
jgi:hypothetical protein